MTIHTQADWLRLRRGYLSCHSQAPAGRTCQAGSQRMTPCTPCHSCQVTLQVPPPPESSESSGKWWSDPLKVPHSNSTATTAIDKFPGKPTAGRQVWWHPMAIPLSHANSPHLTTVNHVEFWFTCEITMKSIHSSIESVYPHDIPWKYIETYRVKPR